MKAKRENPIIDMWSRKELLDIYLQTKPLCVNIEINQFCKGGCEYCYASSMNRDDLRRDNLSLEMFKNILRMKKLGTRVIYLYGGDQLLHPNFEEMLFYAIQDDFHVVLPLSGLIPETKVPMLVEASKLAKTLGKEFFVGIHIDTLDQDVYNQVNCVPSSLQEKINGYKALLDAGFPADRTYGCPTLTGQTAGTIIPLMKWFYEKGAKHIAIITFRPLGLARDKGAMYEPTLSQIKKAFYFRAKIEGKHMLAVGSSDGKYACQCHVGITAKGDVVPCLLLRDLPEGNIYNEDILKIVRRKKDKLLLNIKVKGPCAKCKFRTYCIGCRANAHIYLNDITASDPKCFFNPQAPKKCF